MECECCEARSLFSLQRARFSLQVHLGRGVFGFLKDKTGRSALRGAWRSRTWNHGVFVWEGAQRSPSSQPNHGQGPLPQPRVSHTPHPAWPWALPGLGTPHVPGQREQGMELVRDAAQTLPLVPGCSQTDLFRQNPFLIHPLFKFSFYFPAFSSFLGMLGGFSLLLNQVKAAPSGEATAPSPSPFY